MDDIVEVIISLNKKQNKTTAYEVANVCLTHEDGSKVNRVVTVSSLLKAFNKSLKEDQHYIKMGKMPYGYYDGEIKMQNGKLSARVITILPAGRQMMIYEQTYYDVYIPSLLFYFRIQEEKLASTSVFALKSQKVDNNTKLFRYPLGNVYDNGNVCWGSNVLGPVNDLKKLEEIMTLFIQSPSSSDLFNGKSWCGEESLTLRALFEQLKGTEEFPDKYLKPIPKGTLYRTVGDLLKSK